MDIRKYDYLTSKDSLSYEFFSDGPKGRIRKIVKYSLQYLSDDIAFYNLTFGDWNEAEKKIDDLIISNNNGKERILATVALTIIEFSQKYPLMLCMYKAVPLREQEHTKWALTVILKRLNSCFMFLASSKIQGGILLLKASIIVHSLF